MRQAGAATEAPPASPPDSPANGRGSGNLPPRDSSRHSIISGKSGRSQRIDTFGNAIEKGKRMHHCAFPDYRDPNQSVEEKIEVTAYKGSCWNNYETQPGCSCSLM
mmetsp:Transcript_97005/g.274346  ORF Transcript_97005/g.274346 Transcript_97005/m.274346 type:complete len:106 (-) Transcript_97005:145-462(-)